MNLFSTFMGLFSNLGNTTWQMLVMWAVGGLLIYLGIVKKMEPTLLVPMGFGAILVNLPLSGAITQGSTEGPITALFHAGMSNELFPLLLFIGIGAMIDFGPLLQNPKLLIFGAAAQFGVFAVVVLATLLGFESANAQLDTRTPARDHAALLALQSLQTAIKEMHGEKFSPAKRMDYTLLKARVDYEIWQLNRNRLSTDPLYYTQAYDAVYDLLLKRLSLPVRQNVSTSLRLSSTHLPRSSTIGL